MVDLDGSVTQLVTLLNADTSLTTSCGTGSCFATLRSLKGAGAGAIEFNSSAKATTLMQFTGDSVYAPGQTLIAAGTPDFQTAVTVAGAIGWQVALTRGATFQVDTLIAWGTSQALIVGETIPTRVLGEYQLVGGHPGAIVVDGATGVLDVTGAVSVGSGSGPALVTRGNGRVRMSQATDTLAVLGDADFGGVTVAGEMTNGVLVIGGSFVMSNEADDAFIAGGAHVTRFTGANATATFFAVGGNRFANLEINSASGFTFAGDAAVGGDVVLGPTTSVVGGGLITIGGDLIDAVGTRWQATQTVFQAVDPVIPPQFTGSVAFLNGVVLDTATSIGGILEIRGGLLDLNGRRVDVAGQFEASDAGALRMVNAADTLVVGGAATFRGASSAGQLSAGHLELRGDFSQLGNAESFSAGGTHVTLFSGTATQGAQFANPGANAGFSHFANLAIGQPAGATSVNLATDAFAIGQLRAGTGTQRRFTSSTGLTLTTHGADIIGVAFDNVRWQLRGGAPVATISGVSFSNMVPSVVQFDAERGADTAFVNSMTFNTVPSNGAYVRVADVDGATGGAFVLAMSATTPALHGGAVQVSAPAVLVGWYQFPPLQGIVWTGAVSSSWNNPGNWNLSRQPIATDSVSINGSVVAGAGNPYVVDLDVGATVAKLVVGASAALTFNHSFGQTLTVSSFSSMPAGTTLNITNGSVLNGAGDINFGGFLNWNGGTLAGAGTMNVQAGSTANIATSGAVTLNGRQVRVGGAASLGGAGFAAVGTPTIEVEATGTLGFTATTSYFSGNGLVNLVNNGTLRKAASAGLVRVDWPISNTGTLEVTSGVLDLRNTLTHSSGTISILANATLVNGGSTVASAAVAIADFGTLTLQSGGPFANAGNHIFGPTSSISGLGALRINSADTVRIQGALNIDSLTVQNGDTWFESASDTMFVTNGAYLGGGFVRGTGILAIRGAFSTSTGNMNGTGTIAVRPTGTFTLQSPLRGWTVDVAGTLVWGDYNLSFEVEPVSGIFASVRIRTAGVFDIQHATTYRELFATGFNPLPNNELTLDVGAIVRKSSGSAISNLRPRVFHSGVFNVLSGTINVQGLCSVTGGTKTGTGSLTGNCGNFP